MARRRSNSDPYDAYNRDRIGKVSRDVFDNEDFRRAHASETSEEQKLPRQYEKAKEWQPTWEKANAAAVKGSEANAFRYNSAKEERTRRR